MTRPTRAILSERALNANIAWVKSLSGDGKLIAMVKCNAYGHGLRSVSLRIASLVDGLGVATIDEALILRQCGVVVPIHVMQGFIDEVDLRLCYEHNLVPVVYRWEQINMLDSLHYGMAIWVKIQTGLNRLGFLMSDMQKISEWKNASKHDVGWMTHWCCADDPDSYAHKKQYDNVLHLSDNYPWERISINNSAGLVAAPLFNQYWLRVGAAIYGIAMPNKLNAVMELRSKVIQCRPCSSGETIGYGASYTFDVDTNIAIVTIGYGDGYPRLYKRGLSVLIGGKRFLVIGRVSMDMLAIDIGNHDIKVGDEVILWGDSLSVDEVALYADMISYQLVCSVHNRVKFYWD